MNNLRDGLLGMTKIPQDVKNAMDSTLQAITTSTGKLENATNSNDRMVNKINELFDEKLNALDKHIQETLATHENKLNSIKDDFLTKSNDASKNTVKLTTVQIEHFLLTTSILNLRLLYAIKYYLVQTEEKGKQPWVYLDKLAVEINSGKEDPCLPMYLFACIVVCSSISIIDYENDGDQLQRVRFTVINDDVKGKLEDVLKQRADDDNVAYEKIERYIESLFGVKKGQNKEQEYGTPID